MVRLEAERGEAPSPSSGERSECVFRREGEYWTIVYEGTLFRLRDRKGLRHLARLLGRPGEKLDVRELASSDEEPPSSAPTDAERARFAVTKRIKEALRKIRANHPSLGDHLVANVKTGRLCGYAPDPRQGIKWTL